MELSVLAALHYNVSYKDGCLRKIRASAVEGWTAEQLVKSCGFTLIEWDGSTSFALVDRLGNIIARCVGFPADSRWPGICQGACEAMDRALKAMKSPQRDPDGRRGWFWTLFTGFSMGGGQQHPMPMDMKHKANANAAKELCQDQNIRKIAHHGSAAYAFTLPKAFSFLDRCLLAVEAMATLLCLPALIRPFPFSIFPAVTFNLGSNVTTRLHRDFHNIIFGMCAIHALGRYDYTKGGHLILWDWKLVIEFPPGTTILIPSAAVAHGNTPLADPQNEERKSFTQYVPGGIVRWFSYGYRTEGEMKVQDFAQWQRVKKQAENRWKEECSMFSKVDELHSDILEHLHIVREDQPGVVHVTEVFDEGGLEDGFGQAMDLEVDGA